MQKVLEAKLKRHKISYSIDGDKINLGKIKPDYITLFGYILLPLIAALGLIIFSILNNIDLFSGNGLKVTAGILMLSGFGVFNINKQKYKSDSNADIKIIGSNSVLFKNEFGSHEFKSNEIKDFIMQVEELNEEVYLGSLILLDNIDREFVIFAIEDESQQYVVNDLKWFSNFFIKKLKVKWDEESQNNKDQKS
jgi:hypothetical protein